MSKSWMTIENDFPSFTGRESPQEMISKLTDYLFKLTNQLKYTLQNLDTSNWNQKALEGFSAETTEGVEESVRLLTNQMGQLSAALNSLGGRVSDNSLSISDTQNAVSLLEDDNTAAKAERQQMQADIGENQAAITALQEESAQAQQERTDMQAAIDDNRQDIEMLLQLEQTVTQLEQTVTQLEETVTALSKLIQTADGVLTLGAEGARINLVGEVYINGVAHA